MLIAIVIIAFLVVGFIDLKLRKKFNIEKNVKFMDQYVGKWHLVLEVFLCLFFLSFVTVNAFEQTTIYALLFIFIMLLFAIRGFLEYFFRRNKRQYILSLTYAALCAFCSLALLIFM